MIEDIKPLVEFGAAVHLLRPNSKLPLYDKWSELPVMSFDELKAKFKDDMNVGIRLGKFSKIGDKYLHAFDMDIRVKGVADEAYDALLQAFPNIKVSRMPTVISGSGGDSRHHYFLSDEPFPKRNIARSKNKMIDANGKSRWEWEVDLYGTGVQAVLPPSIHPDTGEEYRWKDDKWLDEYAVIPTISADDITEVIYGESVYGSDRDEETLVPLDLTFDEAREALEELSDWADAHETWRNVGMALKHEFGDDGWELFDEWSKNGSGYNRRNNRVQWKGFKNGRSNPITMRSVMKEVKERNENDAIEAALADMDAIEDDDEDNTVKRSDLAPEPRRGDPDMSVLKESSVPAPDFPLHLLGERWAKHIKRASENAGSLNDFVAAGLMCAMSAMIGNTVRVEIRPGYTQPVTLWAQIIGSPSTLKSPALRVSTSILTQIETEYEPYYRKAYDKWKNEKMVAEALQKEWMGRLKAMMAEGKEDLNTEMPNNCKVPKEPNRRQSILNDVTIEAFMRAQARNPRGFMIFRDEMSGWLGSMERHSAEAERGAWLESYDGGSYSIERVKDGNVTLRIPRMCAPILGGIQPERLLTITSADKADDGLQARFLPFWPDVSPREMSYGVPDEGEMLAWFGHVAEMRMDVDEYDVPQPTIMKFERKAFDAFKAWSDKRKLEELFVHSRLAAVYGKSEGQVARIAAIFEVMWWACSGKAEDTDPPATVSVAAVKASIEFRETYIKHMQRRVFAHSIETLENTNARAIARWIVENDVDEVNLRDMRRSGYVKGISGATPTEVVEEAIAVLIRLRWLTAPEESRSDKRGGGRPPKKYYVNSRVWDLIK